MSVTAARLRAVVTADTAQAQRGLRDFGRTVSSTARDANRELGSIGQALGGLPGSLGQIGGMLGGALTIAGAATFAVQLGKTALLLDTERQQAENVRKTLIAYAGGAQTAAAATKALTEATDGGVSKMQAQQMAAQLLGMGLAKTSDQVGQLTRMAVMLGDKTLTVEQRMASWNAMLANQSIERLDTFGISSGRVRQRIEEMQAAMPGLSREQAFVNSVLEIGAGKLAAVEAQGVEAATSIDKVRAAAANLKQAVGNQINIKIAVEGAASAMNTLAGIISGDWKAEAPTLMALDRVTQAEWELKQAKEERAQAGRDGYDAELLAQYDEQVRIATENLRQANVELGVTKAMADTTGLSMLSLGDNAAYAASQVARVGQAGLNRRGDFDLGLNDRMTRGSTLPPATPVRGSKAWNDMQEAERARAEFLRERNKAIASDAGKSYQDAMTAAGKAAASKISGYLQEGMNFSIGLNNMTQNPLAPGQGGPFEQIYRLQAWLKDGSWGDVAAKAGGDRGQIEQLVKSFQMGNFTDQVLGMVDLGGLQQIAAQKAQAEASQEKLAGLLGGDKTLIKSLLGQDAAGTGAVLSDADAATLAKGLKGSLTGALDATAAEQPTVINKLLGFDGATFDFSGLVGAIASAMDKQIKADGKKLEESFAKAWDAGEPGFIKRAGESTAFYRAIGVLVDSYIASQLEQ